MKQLPNILTVSRIFLTFIFVGFIFQSGFSAKLMAALVFLAGALSDLLDGYLARKYKLISDFGKLMDPIADKFLVLSAFFVFAKMQIIPMWMCILIAVREIYITVWRLVETKKGKVLAAEKAGKYKTILQMVTILVILLFVVGRESFIQGNINHEILWLKIITVLMYMCVILTVYSGIQFLWHNRKPKYVR